MLKYLHYWCVTLKNEVHVILSFDCQGLLLLSLADGQQVTEMLPEIPAGFSPEFQDFLSKFVAFSLLYFFPSKYILQNNIGSTIQCIGAQYQDNSTG